MKRSPLTRKTPLRSKPLRSVSNGIGVPERKPAKRSGFTPASVEQRQKVRGAGSIVSGDGPCDAAHLWPRAAGGCDSPLCVVPLTRLEHRAFDDGTLDLLPYLIAHGLWAELAHMVGEHRADPISMLERLTGDRWSPVERAA